MDTIDRKMEKQRRAERIREELKMLVIDRRAVIDENWEKGPIPLETIGRINRRIEMLAEELVPKRLCKHCKHPYDKDFRADGPDKEDCWHRFRTE